MGFIVQKFGGTSVADAKCLRRVASIVEKTYKSGNDVVVVVSAQGDTTDTLIAKANEINPNASKREFDMLLSVGEQVSISLLAMTLEKMNVPVISLLGWQAGFVTTSDYGNARIRKVNSDRIRKELDKKNVVIVAGFQGLNKYDDITTLGRGGSDTSAVAIATAMHADLCQIYTDVEGVYTADPRKVAGAKKLDEISYDEMLELATLGAQVLNNRSVEMAKKHNVKLEVLSSMSNAPGTIIREKNEMEQTLISGVAKDDNVALVSVIGVPDVPGYAFRIFSKLASKNVNVDVILQSTSKDGTKDISFTVKQDQLYDTVNMLKEYSNVINCKDINYDENVSKVSIVGAGIETHPGIASQLFEALFEAQVNIQMISTSEIKLSVVVNSADADMAVSAIHKCFFDCDE